MRKVEDTYRAMSKELTLEDWLARSRRLGVRRQRDAADRSPAVRVVGAQAHQPAAMGRHFTRFMGFGDRRLAVVCEGPQLRGARLPKEVRT